MSNAAKYRKKAAEFEQLKQIDRAIASYVKAIEESEAAGEDIDVALYNKVGDLALRQGRVPDAITYYERAVEHYATSGLFNNAIALCNKILRNAPGRANVYFTLGRISARKGLRGDATRNFLEYATRMQQEGRIEEGIRALAEVLDIMPELNDVRTMVEDLAARSGIALPRRRTPLRTDRVPTPASTPAVREQKSQDLIFLDIDYGAPARRTPVATAKVPTPVASAPVAPVAGFESTSPVSPSTPALTPAPGLPLLDISERHAPVTAALDERVADTPVDEPVALSAAEPVPEVEQTATEAEIDVTMVPAPLDGLEANGEFADTLGTPVLEGFTTDEPVSAADVVDPSVHPSDVTWVTPLESVADTIHLDEVVSEDFENAMIDPGVVKAIYTETPRYVPALIEDALIEPEIDAEPTIIEPLVVESVPELDEAIAAGLELVERAEAAEQAEARLTTKSLALTPVLPTPVAPTIVVPTPAVPTPAVPTPVAAAAAVPTPPLVPAIDLDTVEEMLPPTRPPFRLDPHDFILPGELPPLLLSDEVVNAGLELSGAPAAFAAAPARTATPRHSDVVADGPLDAPIEAPVITAASTVQVVAEPTNAEPANEPAEDEVAVSEPSDSAAPGTVEALPLVPASGNASLDTTDLGDALADEEFVADTDETIVPPTRPLSGTPSLPIAAVAEAAATVATSRRDSLRAAVARLPKNWLLRRRLAEALFEAGERDAALHELETAQQGLVNDGEFTAASDIADELVQVSPDRVAYHQKRVELAVRGNDQQRLRLAYLDLADALVRLGEEGRARAVYARVLEIDPYDDRARAALGAAAPPPPPPVRPDDEKFVDLADWLRDDDKPVDTRMRMREPAISGDEQADFDALLRHFKEGVSRSLGEDDFESHYDLGVAYKEMGLLDDAITEFQKALRSRTHRLPAYEALGQCFVEQGRFQVAATVLSRALHEPGLDDDKRVGVLYLLGYSCEALQRKDEARSYFQRVYATDINFRDVAARLAAIEQASR